MIKSNGKLLKPKRLASGLFQFKEGTGIDRVVLVTQVARLVGNSDLLGQASTQGVGTGNDDTVVNTQLQERVTYSVDLDQDVGVRNGYFTVLVATLLLVRTWFSIWIQHAPASISCLAIR